MTTMYMVFCNTISKVQVEKETDKTFICSNGQRRSKSSDIATIYPTFEQAREHVNRMVHEEICECANRIKRLSETLKKTSDLKESEVK